MVIFHFRPRLYYKYAMHNGEDYDGYVEYSLSYLPTEAWYRRNISHAYHEFVHNNISQCYYQHWRNSTEESNFSLTQDWWQIACVRLAVFCIFIVLGFTFQWLYDFLVSDVPSHIKLKMQRRRHVVTKAMEAEILSDKWLRHPGQHRGSDPGAENGNACGEGSAAPETSGSHDQWEEIPLSNGEDPKNAVSADDASRIGSRLPNIHNGNRACGGGPQVETKPSGPHRTASMKTAITMLA